jgi:3',5'-cyclic AMP phosphodiesterase CpdA
VRAFFLFAIAALIHAGTASAAILERHPSLWQVTTQSILIAWKTDVATPGKVQYGTTLALGSEATDGVTATNHAVTLTGLAPATRYFYKVVAGVDPLTPGDDTLHTAPTGPSPFRFVAFGDCGTDDANQYAVAARVNALNPDLGLILGDVIYEAGEAANFTPRYFTPYRSIIRRSVWYPVVGNHDIATANGQPFVDAFYLPTNSRDGTEKYYSFEYANVHFVAIDGNQKFNADMYDWLEMDLALTTMRWKIVYFHQPMYSDPGGHGNDLDLQSNLEPIFVNHKVDLVLQGHSHYYCRSYPISNGVAVDTTQGTGYRDPRGVIYIVAGGGGRGLYAVTNSDPRIRAAYSVFHTTAVDVVGDSVYVQAVLPNGTVFDSFSIVKSIATGVEITNPTASSESGGIRLRARPNPFDRQADLSFMLPRAATVRLTVSDVHGRRVRQLVTGSLLIAGVHAVRWDGKTDRGKAAATGIYFATLEAGGTKVRTRLALLR